jgi:hypothetical protein
LYRSSGCIKRMEEIKLDNIDNVDLGISEISLDADSGLDGDLHHADFGGGIELLMNDKVKNKHNEGHEKKNGIDAARTIEQDLKEIEHKTIADIEINKEIQFEDKSSFHNKPTIEIAKATSTMEMGNDTWDGYKNISTMDIDDEFNKSKKKSAQDILKEKFEILRKLEQLESKGATLSKKYTMESDLQEMQGEYEHLIQEKERSNSVKFQGKILTTMITGLEFLNSKFDPFDVKLDGWSEQINENIDDYDEIFAELHEKYKSKAKMAPELKLLFQLASSGMMIHMTNTMFKSALPGMDDIMRQNPDLMNHFTKAAISSMEQNSPGLSNFMNDFGMSHSRDTNEIRSRPETFQSSMSPSQPPARSSPPTREAPKREEMKGPGNIDSLLSSLGKGKNNESKNITLDKSSTVSIEDVDNISLASASSSKRKSSKRKSDKNTISLAI